MRKGHGRRESNFKKAILIAWWFIVLPQVGISQQNPIDSLNKIIESGAHDTTRVLALYDILNYAPLNECEDYNNQMLALLQNIFNDEGSDNALKFRYLPYLSEAYYNKGVFLSNRNMADSSLMCYNKALLLYQFLKDDQMTAYIAMSMAIIHTTEGEYAKAIHLLYQSLKIHEKNKDFEGVGDTYLHIGRVYHIQKEYEEAQRFTQKALEAYRHIDYRLGISESLFKLGIIQLDMTHVAEAMESFKSCYISIESLNSKDRIRREQMACTCLGYIAYHNEKYDSSIVYFKKSIDYSIENNETYRLAIRYLNIARTYSVIGDHLNAVKYGEMAYQMAIETNSLDDQYDALSFLSQAYKNVGNYKSALSSLELYVVMHDSIQDAEQKSEIIKQHYQYEYEKQQFIENVRHKQELNNIVYQNNKKNYLRNTFFIIMGFIVVAIVIVTLLLIKHQKQKTIIEKQKGYLYKQKMLKLQMNPHFIFNIINSIQNFILQKNEKDAYSYLAKFSKLMRMVLNNSDKDSIVLHEEIDLIKAYVSIEQLRFDHSFDFQLIVDESVKEQELYIPPMLLQPFIENAIWHGLMNLGDERKGVLRVTFKMEVDRLKVTIEDNGIGRERAMAIKKESHKSMAVNLTQERMQIIDYLYKKDSISLRYYDLTNEFQQTEGTGVEIFLPLSIGFENSHV